MLFIQNSIFIYINCTGRCLAGFNVNYHTVFVFYIYIYYVLLWPLNNTMQFAPTSGALLHMYLDFFCLFVFITKSKIKTFQSDFCMSHAQPLGLSL